MELEDGAYEAMIVDAESRPEGGIRCDVTLLDGDHKGDVVTIRADLDIDPLELLAVPGTLHVEDGQPRLVVDP